MNSFNIVELFEDCTAKLSNKKKIRVGRGDASRRGVYAGKGRKGLKVRSGGNVKLNYEGGQTPLFRKAKKYGFVSLKNKNVEVLSTDFLIENKEKIKNLDSVIDVKQLLIENTNRSIKRSSKIRLIKGKFTIDELEFLKNRSFCNISHISKSVEDYFTKINCKVNIDKK